mgnify:CR=1 FL=1
MYLLSRCSGLRDDLNFLLEEDLSSINLCSLHCEMRNCEQLLGSLGLFAYRVGTLGNLNTALSAYGPENCRSFSRITVKERKGQQTAIDRQNIHVASFSGKMLFLKCCVYISFIWGHLWLLIYMWATVADYLRPSTVENYINYFICDADLIISIWKMCNINIIIIFIICVLFYCSHYIHFTVN